MAASAAVRSSPYGRLLRSPGVGWQAVGGLLAQVTQGATSVGVILVIRQYGGSLAEGGTVVGALWVAAGVARPLQGRLIDRRGSAKVLAWCGVTHALALTGIVLVSRDHGAVLLLVVIGFAGGLALPPMSSSMRVQWAKLVDAGERTAAYSLVYLTQEISVLIGPLLIAGAVGVASAAAGLVAVAALTAAGALIFAASVGAVRAGEGESPPGSRVRVLAIPAMRLLLILALLLGTMLGALQVAVTALATAHRTPAVAGVLIACVSVGGIVGAVGYGSRRWGAGPDRRLQALLLVVTVALAPLIALDSLVAAGALLALAGIAFNPSLTTFSLLIDQEVPMTAAAEAFGWFSTALAAGTGAGSVTAGALTHARHAFHAGFIVAAAAMAVATLLSLRARHAERPGWPRA